MTRIFDVAESQHSIQADLSRVQRVELFLGRFRPPALQEYPELGQWESSCVH